VNSWALDVPVNGGSWDKSSVRVTGSCMGDSIVRFVIHNTGVFGNGDMDGPSEYRVFIDGGLVVTSNYQIQGGKDLILDFPANGQTIRLEADQRPGHLGLSRPNDVVEACGVIILGSVASQPTDDEDLEIEEENQNLIFYPNPTSGNLSIKFTQLYDIIEIKVINVAGQVISSSKHYSKDQLSIDLEGPKGFYILEVNTSNGISKKTKVLKK